MTMNLQVALAEIRREHEAEGDFDRNCFTDFEDGETREAIAFILNAVVSGAMVPTAERDALRAAMEGIAEQAERPEYRSLEVGFRHSQLTGKELVERLRETCLFIAQDARAALNSLTERQKTAD